MTTVESPDNAGCSTSSCHVVRHS